MRETRDHPKKMGDITGTFHVRIGIIKERNVNDLIKGEEIKKAVKEYTEDPYNKGLNNPDNHDGVVNYLEPDILEYEVK